MFFLLLVFVFTPNSKTIVYKKQNIFGKNNEHTSILWTLFAPKSDHQNKQSSSWLDNSTLYILTNHQVIICIFLFYVYELIHVLKMFINFRNS